MDYWLTSGLQRYVHFNHFPAGADLLELQADAAQYADPEWNAEFYDAIAEHVPNYVPSSQRGTWKLRAALPKGATNAVAVLAQDGVSSLGVTVYLLYRVSEARFFVDRGL